MKPIVMFASKSGNTKKIADSIAAQIGCEAVRVTANSDPSTMDLESYDLIFLGTGLYAGTPNEDLVRYLTKMNLKTVKRFAVFITRAYAGDKMALTRLRTLLESKNQKMIDDYFAAFGGWGALVKRGHPKSDEVQAAGQWAKKLVDSLERA